MPAEAIHDGDHQSGVINPKLNFPLEDLYPDGQEAGQVGQEIYGCGAAFAFAVRSQHRIENAPFRLYCNQFIRASERSPRAATRSGRSPTPPTGSTSAYPPADA